MRFIDSNVFIYHLAADPIYGVKAKNILKRIEEGEQAATSTLVITQVCSYLKWKKEADVIPVFLSLLKKLTSLNKIETLTLDFEEAKTIQLKLNLPWDIWDDLVIAAQMKRLGITEIYSNDEDFDKISWIKRIF
ncbi:type II toxin-antitoxin system VapC family toxin [Candidatus Bathyarchaeota archaeon]|nr:type II toxin-antitoxin system VapC family toxin [Candidatus Bathyarchaeota archaeon]